MDIIIVNHNSTDCCIKSIESIYCSLNGLTIRIVVVDNASCDNPERINYDFPDIHLILNKENIGFAKAINAAFRLCNAPYIIILNPDTIISNNFFEGLFAFLETNPTIGVLGPKIFDENGKIQGSARKFPTPWTSIFGRKSPLTILFPNNPITKKEFISFNCTGKEPVETDWVSGACMVINRKAFEEVNGFDEHFFLYWEDTDICKRIKDNGWQVVYLPSISVTHIVGQSSSSKPIFSTLHFHRSCFYLFRKHAKKPLNKLMPIAFLFLSMRAEFVVCLHLIDKLSKSVRSKANKTLGQKQESGDVLENVTILQITGRINNGLYLRLLGKNYAPHRDIEPILRRSGSVVLDIILHCYILYKIIKRYDPSIVHTVKTRAGLIGRIVTFAFNAVHTRRIRTVHTIGIDVLGDCSLGNVKKLLRLVEKILSKKTNRIIVASKTQKYEVCKKYKIADCTKITVTYPKLDLKKISRNDELRKHVRNKYNISKDTILIGSVGKLVHRKNHILLIKALAEIVKKDRNKPIKMIVFGEGELKYKLMEYSNKHDISKHIIFSGWENNSENIYAGLDVLAHTSTYEDMPLPIIEAMASFVPVITTGVGGVKELLGKIHETHTEPNGFKLCERGILCLKHDPIVFANGIEYIIQNAFSVNLRMLKNARDFVFKNFNEQKLVWKDSQGLYKDLS